MKLACETCPFWTWTRDSAEHGPLGACHHASVTADDLKLAGWWCSLHPAAPQPFHEQFVCESNTTPGGPGWEPVAVASSARYVLWRRIAAYTKGGE